MKFRMNIRRLKVTHFSLLAIINSECCTTAHFLFEIEVFWVFFITILTKNFIL